MEVVRVQQALEVAEGRTVELREEVEVLRGQVKEAGGRVEVVEKELRVTMERLWESEERCRSLQVRACVGGWVGGLVRGEVGMMHVRHMHDTCTTKLHVNHTA